VKSEEKPKPQAKSYKKKRTLYSDFLPHPEHEKKVSDSLYCTVVLEVITHQRKEVLSNGKSNNPPEDQRSMSGFLSKIMYFLVAMLPHYAMFWKCLTMLPEIVF
jgi:hypothetical protein